jgi:hypothetical protein
MIKNFDFCFQLEIVAYDNNPPQAGETSLKSSSSLLVKTTKNEQPIFDEQAPVTMYFLGCSLIFKTKSALSNVQLCHHSPHVAT